MPRVIEIPEGCKAILVTDQFLDAHGTDWCSLDGLEARFAPHEPDALVVDIESRYSGEHGEPA